MSNTASTVSASAVSRLLSRAGFTRGSQFRVEKSSYNGRACVRVHYDDWDKIQRTLEGNGYETFLHPSTGDLFVLRRAWKPSRQRGRA